MIKASKMFVLLQKDLDDGLVKVKERNDFIEYWIYEYEKSDLLSTTGKYLLNTNKKLKSVIMCARNHIQCKEGERIFIEGVRFTDDLNGQNLDEYLKKTNRGYNG